MDKYKNRHYISQVRCFVTNTIWETHNDLVKKIVRYKIPGQIKVNLHLLVYFFKLLF